MAKIVPIEGLSQLVSELRRRGKKIVTTNGAFDILHVGHKRSLEASRSLGDVLIVGVNSDASVRQYKSPDRPIIKEGERVELLSGLACVDYAVIFNEPDPINFLEIVKPDIHVKSGDYKAEELIEYKTVNRNGGKVVITPYIEGKSTTALLQSIRRNNE